MFPNFQENFVFTHSFLIQLSTGNHSSCYNHNISNSSTVRQQKRRGRTKLNSFFFVDFSHFFLNWFQWIRLRIGKRTKYFWAGEFNREDNVGRRGLRRLWLTLSFQDPTLHLNYKLLLNPKLMMILLLFSSPFIPRSGGVSLTTHDTGSLIFFPTQSEKVRRKTMFKSSLKKRKKKKDPKWPTNNLIHR